MKTIKLYSAVYVYSSIINSDERGCCRIGEHTGSALLVDNTVAKSSHGFQDIFEEKNDLFSCLRK